MAPSPQQWFRRDQRRRALAFVAALGLVGGGITVFELLLAPEPAPSTRPPAEAEDPALRAWYHVDLRDAGFGVRVDPPNRMRWTHDTGWSDVKRVCFRAHGPRQSDELLVFEEGREHSLRVPTEADGGSALVEALVERDLVPGDGLLQTRKKQGSLTCWPPLEAGRL